MALKSGLRLSVRELVEFSARSGDLSGEAPAGPTAAAGRRGHQRIQAGRDDSWQSEISLSAQVRLRDCTVELSGRVDLLKISPAAPAIVEEIKTTLAPPQHLAPSQRQLHRAQAMTYAWLLLQCADAVQLPPDHRHAVEVRVSWFDLLHNDLQSESQVVTQEELQTQVMDCLATYLDWYLAVQEQRRLMRQSARDLAFPYPEYRPQQRQLARYVYRCIREAESLLLESPTGSGKTLSVLYPGVRALGDQLAARLVYLTARGSCQQMALAALQLLREMGWQGTALLLRARDKTCPCRDDPGLLGEDGICSRKRGYHDRLPEARVACLEERFLEPGRLQRIAEHYELCPFALGLEMLPWVDAVICDLNYLLDPLVGLAALQEAGESQVLLVDEAHNLPSRARDMYSASFSTQDGGELVKLANRHYRQSRRLGNLNRTLSLAMAAALPVENPRHPPAAEVQRACENLLLELARLRAEQSEDREQPAQQPLLREQPGTDSAARLLELEKKLLRYTRVSELFSDAHRHSLKRAQARESAAESRLQCLDASRYVGRFFTSSTAVIAFSATLQPLDFYARALALPHAPQLRLPSSFPAENQLTLLAGYIDTRWQRRAESIASLTELIQCVARARPGNYLVFFPSYHYLQQVEAAFADRYPTATCVVQSSADDESSRAKFIAAFRDDTAPKIGFAVLGGLYSEALDLVGDRLSGSLVVSPALAQPGCEQDWLQEYYRECGLDGFAYASQYPGFTRVMQAAGRVIRSATDRGVVVLIDPRFRRPDYRRLFPPHWQPRDCHGLDAVKSGLQDFWR